MSAIGKVVDVTVLGGSAYVGYKAVKTITESIKVKNYATTAVGVVTVLICAYAFKEAWEKLSKAD